MAAVESRIAAGQENPPANPNALKGTRIILSYNAGLAELRNGVSKGLREMGAQIVSSEDLKHCTHLVYNDGDPALFWKAQDAGIPCLDARWAKKSIKCCERVPERHFEIDVDDEDAPPRPREPRPAPAPKKRPAAKDPMAPKMPKYERTRARRCPMCTRKQHPPLLTLTQPHPTCAAQDTRGRRPALLLEPALPRDLPGRCPAGGHTGGQ